MAKITSVWVFFLNYHSSDKKIAKMCLYYDSLRRDGNSRMKTILTKLPLQFIETKVNAEV